jgi:nitrite reductase (NADH) small subunit
VRRAVAVRPAPSPWGAALAPLLLQGWCGPRVGRQCCRAGILRYVVTRQCDPLAEEQEDKMSEQWKVICKVKDIPLQGARMVQRGFAWQELPGVVLLRTDGDNFIALLDRSAGAGCIKRFRVKVADGQVSLDMKELSEPASKAEAALAGAFGVATQFVSA